MSLDACDSTKYSMNRLRQPLEELTKFLKGETFSIYRTRRGGVRPGAGGFFRATEAHRRRD